MTRTWTYLLGCAAVLASFQAAAQIRLYEHDQFRGRSFTTERGVGDFTSAGFNDRASSVIVSGGRWVVCDDSRFGGNCVRLRPGRYPSLSAIGLNDRVSSARPDEGGWRVGDGGDRDDRYRDRNRYTDGRYQDRDGRWRDRDGRYLDHDGRWQDRDGRWRDRDGRYLDRDGRYQDRDGRWRDRDGRPIGGHDRDRRADERGLTPIEREVNRDILRRQNNPDPSP